MTKRPVSTIREVRHRYQRPAPQMAGHNSTINARDETVASKPAFRSAYKLRRCLVLADGYYEWLRVGEDKQPYLYEVVGGNGI